MAAVKEILAQVRAGGDAALAELTERFDGVRPTLRVPAEALVEALDSLDPQLRAALEEAAAGIADFHRTQVVANHTYERNGIVVEGRKVPVDRAGCYVPGGRAIYPSTVLMTAIPAKVAGVPEVVVIVDDTAPVDLAAVDVILQAEHGPGGLAWLISWSEDALNAICAEIEAQVAVAPRRDDITSTFAEGGYAVLCDSPEQAVAVSNTIAPEHLEIITADPGALVPLVRHAGAVFCGPWSPASVGDYLAGPSHVLPTDGTARFGSALTVSDFVKDVHVITLDRAALERAAPVVAAIADAEGLAAHAESVRRRVGRPVGEA